jgi:hypothetical protein
MSPACGCQQSVRLERLLSEATADSWPHSGLAEFLSIADVTRRSCDLHQRGDDPVGVGVMRAPHLTHAAAAQQLDKAITPERRALHRSPYAARRFTDRHSRRRREQCGHGRAASVKCHVGTKPVAISHRSERSRPNRLSGTMTSPAATIQVEHMMPQK